MTDDYPDTGRVAEAFHGAFVAAYVALARQKYPRFAARLPFHGQDVHVIYGGNQWWQILCVPGQRYGDIRFGPAGRFTLQRIDPIAYPDIASLGDRGDSRKAEFRIAMDAADTFIYHEAFAPPWPGPEAEETMPALAAQVAEHAVVAHAAPFLEFETLKARVANMRNSSQLFQDMTEAQSCMRSEHYRAAIVTACAAAESALVGRLEELGHPIRQEERSRVLGHEHHSFPMMVTEIYRQNGVTIRTRDRLELMNGLRRGTEHSRPDATYQDDAQFCWDTLQQLLNELAKK